MYKKPQFMRVDSKYGAPLGRRSKSLPQNCPDHTITVFRVALDEGHDDGGAYWGCGGLPLWCARCVTDADDYVNFCRAETLIDALEVMNIEDYLLVNK